MAGCFMVRKRVFIEEQSVPESLEVDGLDALCAHFIAELGGEPIGTARLRFLEDENAGKAERVAVLPELRGRGIGGRLMDLLEAEALRRRLDCMVLHAQVSALAFYTRRGYVEEGPRFEEAGIEHQEMRLSFAVQRSSGKTR
jgi:predicted GNAT family N-acyltransferase